MLYSNDFKFSLAYGDIDYVAEHLSDYLTKGKPEKLKIKPTKSSVLKVLREYNATHGYAINLYKHLE